MKMKNIIKTIFKPLVFFFLGCYYFLYGLMFPFRIILKILGDTVFKVYKVKQRKQVSIFDRDELNLATDESTIIEEIDKLKREQTIEKNKPKLSKRTEEKYKEMRKDLLLSLESDAVRSTTPLTFRYTAINEDFKKETNTFIAFSKMEVYTYLENEHYDVLKIETSKLIEFLYGPTSFNSTKFKNKDLIFWLTQLSTYIKSGIPLTNSMRILSKQMSKDHNKKRVFDAIIYNLTLGESFSTALDKQRTVFPQLLINMIKAAEATGDLEATLDDMADYYTETENTRKQMVSAISYPLIIMIFSLGVVGFILIYVIPKFQDVYKQAGAEINSLTTFIINLSSFLSSNIGYILAIIAVIIIIIGTLYKKIKAFRHQLQKLMMKMPVMGNIIIYKEMSIFAKTFSSLLNNNVFITESIDILTNITNNEVYKEIMITTLDNIARGEKISSAFKNHWAVPDVAYYMIVTGESTGELAVMMSKVADYYQTNHKTVIESMKSFIEPALIIFLAVVVGGIVMAVVLPMFGLYSEIM